MDSEARPTTRRAWTPGHLLTLGARLVLVAVLACMGLIAYGLGSPSVTRWLVERLERADPAIGSVEGLSGSLWSGLRATQVRFQHPSGVIEAGDLALQLAWSGLLRGELRFSTISARVLRITSHPAPAADASAKLMGGPAVFALPLSVWIDSLAVDQIVLTVGEQSLMPLTLRARGGYRAGQYRIEQASVNVQGSEWVARDLLLAAHAPFTLSGRLSASIEGTMLGTLAGPSVRLKVPDEPVRIESDWSGRLDELVVQARVRGWDATVALMAKGRALGPSPVVSVEGSIESLSVERVLVNGPTALLDGRFTARYPERQFSLDLGNRRSGPLDRQHLPLHSLRLAGRLGETTIQLEQLDLILASSGPTDSARAPEVPTRSAPARLSGRGTIDLQGSVAVPGGPWPRLSGAFTLSDIELQAIDRRLPLGHLSGSSTIEGSLLVADLAVRGLTDEPVTLEARATAQVDGFRIDQATVRLERTRWAGRGWIGVGAKPRIDLSGRFEQLDPARWIQTRGSAAGALSGDVSGRWQVSRMGASAADLQFEVELDRSSRLGQRPIVGATRGRWRPGRLHEFELRLVQDGDRLSLKGALGAPEDRLNLDAQVADLNRFEPRLNGPLTLTGQVSGALDRPHLSLLLSAPRLSGASWPQPVPRSLALSLTLEGYPDRHALSLEVRAASVRTRMRGEGAWHASLSQWHGRIDPWQIEGVLPATSVRPFDLTVGGGAIRLGGLSLALADGHLDLDELTLSADLVRSSGRLRGVSLSPVADWLDIGGSGSAPPEPPVREAIDRLRAMRIEASWQAQGPDARRLTGQIDLELKTLDRVSGASDRERVFSESRAQISLSEGRLTGRASLKLPSLAFARRLTAPDWQIEGALDFDGRVGGSIEHPELDGRLTGERLTLINRSLGWRLRDGRLAARFDGRRLRLDRLRFASGEQGALELSGEIAPAVAPSARPTGSDRSAARSRAPFDADVTLRLDRFVMPLGPGQRLLLSGQTRLVALDGAVRWSGQVRADEGFLEFGSAGVPDLPSDLVIFDPRGGPAAPQPRTPPTSDQAAERVASEGWTPLVDADIQMALGDRLRVQGGGLDARVTGELVLSGRLPADPRLTGRVQLREGSYVAYGRKLELSRGELRFTGEIDNPVLDILALRRSAEVEAGVSVAGPARTPRIRLVSQPDLPDAQKLSWLVLGTGLEDAAAAGQALALREAALTLLGNDDGGLVGGLSQALGLDSIGFGRSVGAARDTLERSRLGPPGLPSPGAGSTGSTTVRQEVVSVSKRLNSRLTVSYERGLQGLWNLVRLQYEISNRLSLRAQSGSENALDLLYFWWFD